MDNSDHEESDHEESDHEESEHGESEHGDIDYEDDDGRKLFNMGEYTDWSDPRNATWKRAIGRYLDRVKIKEYSNEAKSKQRRMKHMRNLLPGESEKEIKEPPSRVGRPVRIYEEEPQYRRIGNGSNGTVYELVVDHYLEERTVCVKNIRYSKAEFFINHRILTNPKRYPHLLQSILIKDMPAGYTHFPHKDIYNSHYLVMEKAITTLGSHVSKGNGDFYSEYSTQWIFVGDIMSAIVELAEMGYVHDDLHDQNAFLVRRPNIDRLVLVLGDFGSCKKLDYVYIGGIHFSDLKEGMQFIFDKTIRTIFSRVVRLLLGYNHNSTFNIDDLKRIRDFIIQSDYEEIVRTL